MSAQFKKAYNAASTFEAGYKNPEELLIVGLDLPLEEWNEDLWDEARLQFAKDYPLDPEALIRTIDLGGSIPAVEVVKRNDKILVVTGRRRVLGVRAANKILLDRGESVDALINLAFVPTKGRDLSVCVRVENAGRLEDPPWVSAQNAARLVSRGKSLEEIAAIMSTKVTTVRTWLHYLDLAPALKTLVESEALPFSFGVELARGSGTGKPGSGVGEHKIQVLAFEYLKKINSPLKGEIGRQNARNAIQMAKSGEITAESLAALTASTDQEPFKQPEATTTSVPTNAMVTGSNVIDPVTMAPKREDKPRQDTPRGSGKPRQDKPRQEKLRILAKDKIMPREAIRALSGHLEPHPEDAGGDTDLAYHLIQVLLGHDPVAEGLAPWPDVQKRVRRVTGAP